MDLNAGLDRDVDAWFRLDVAHEPAERHVRLALSGQLDAVSAPDLITSVIGLLRDVASVDLDLSAVTFLDAAGIRCLLICRAAATSAGLSLRMVNPAPDVARVLRITGLLDVLTAPAGTPRDSSS